MGIKQGWRMPKGEPQMAIDITELTLKIGACETCKHVHKFSYDPSPSGVSLSPGEITEMECEHPGENLLEAAGLEWQCPLWEPNLGYCEKHGWHIGQSCDACENEGYDEMAVVTRIQVLQDWLDEE
jgi:hypothetical protein